MKSLLIAAIAKASLAVPAFAGFTASTGTDVYTYTGPGTAFAPAVGGTFNVPNQPLQSYTPDTPADPQIVPGDLVNDLFSLNLTVTSTNAVTGAVQTSGTYAITYNYAGGIRVSSGTASLFLTPAFSGFNVATGVLTQTLGPANPAFRDLAYGSNSNFVLQGGYVDTLGGNIALTLRQNAVVPEPTTLAALAGASTLFLRRRRA